MGLMLRINIRTPNTCRNQLWCLQISVIKKAYTIEIGTCVSHGVSTHRAKKKTRYELFYSFHQLKIPNYIGTFKQCTSVSRDQ